jgi:hypothetical protein
MIRRSEKKIPVKGAPEPKPLKQTCLGCGKNKAISNKTRKLCASCVASERKEKQKLRKEKEKKKKAESISTLTKKLDRVFSVYVRLSGADSHGNVKCFTCDRVEYWRKIQNGHFQSRRYYSTRFEPLNTASQCYSCNVGLSGMQYVFGINLDKKYGEGTAEKMIKLSREVKKFTAYEMMELIEQYEKLVMKLRKDKDLWD